MWFRNVIILILIFYLADDFAFAQEVPTKKDSTHIY